MVKEKSKLCIIEDPYELPIRGRINGPILTPSEFSMSELRQLLVAHVKVYEVNPRNKKEKVKLTFQNLGKDNFVPMKKERILSTPAPKKNVSITPKPFRQAKNEVPNIITQEVEPVGNGLTSPDFF